MQYADARQSITWTKHLYSLESRLGHNPNTSDEFCHNRKVGNFYYHNPLSSAANTMGLQSYPTPMTIFSDTKKTCKIIVHKVSYAFEDKESKQQFPSELDERGCWPTSRRGKSRNATLCAKGDGPTSSTKYIIELWPEDRQNYSFQSKEFQTIRSQEI